MKVLFLSRATLYSVYGGDTVQIESTAKYLRRLGVDVDIRLCNEEISYSDYDLIHCFNITRPADLLRHIRKSHKPFLISTIFVDYRDFEASKKSGLSYWTGKILGADRLEYAKALGRWLVNGERLSSMEYLLRGHRNSIRRLVRNSEFLLPNSESEYKRFSTAYNLKKDYRVIVNSIDPELYFIEAEQAAKRRDPYQVICVSRIEGKKNQLNLIRALNDTEFKLTLIGKPAPNHQRYYEECRKIAGPNIQFTDFVPLEEQIGWYLRARVHVLASWNETCGLSSLEAGYAGCNIVITDKGDTKDYFGNQAWYCDPGNPESIYQAVRGAAFSAVNTGLRDKIRRDYTWDNTARQTLEAYKEALNRSKRQVLN